MNDQVYLAQISNNTEVATMATALNRWEPHLELIVMHDESTLYEPDGTLYGIALSDETTMTVRHKPRTVRRGDAIVIPQSVAIDAAPEINLLAIRHDGTPPLHFRERFIQTWGMDYFALDRESSASKSDIIPASPPSFRLSYHVFGAAEIATPRSTDLNLHLLLVQEGQGRLQINEESEYELESDSMVLLPSGVRYRINGQIRVGLIVLESEVAHEARKANEFAQHPSTLSPEYRLPG